MKRVYGDTDLFEIYKLSFWDRVRPLNKDSIFGQYRYMLVQKEYGDTFNNNLLRLISVGWGRFEECFFDEIFNILMGNSNPCDKLRNITKISMHKLARVPGVIPGMPSKEFYIRYMGRDLRDQDLVTNIDIDYAPDASVCYDFYHQNGSKIRVQNSDFESLEIEMRGVTENTIVTDKRRVLK